MKKTKLLNLLRVTFLLLIFSAFTTSALAATITGGTKLYLKPNSQWKESSARFAMYLFNGSSPAKWYSMSDGDGDGIYSATINSDESYGNVIFARMDPNNTTNDWGTRWNSTCDLTYDGTHDLYDISSSSNWGKGNNDNNCEDLTNDNKWSVYSSGGDSGDDSGDTDDDECKTLYLNPSDVSDWSKGDERYVAYFFKNGVGHTWVNMEESSCSGIYKVAVPDIDLTSVIFVRMDGGSVINSWDKKWNQTVDLTFAGANNLFTISNKDGDKWKGNWSSSSCTEKAECYTCKLNSYDETYLQTVTCNSNNTKIIFRETFTFTDDQLKEYGEKSRIAYSVSNDKYSAGIPSYDAMTKPCSAIKDGGYYAMLVNPKYAGWGDQLNGADNCTISGHRWFRSTTDGEITEHTGDANGGMLLFNCKDGSSDKCMPDVLYECVVNDICKNTYINFSAYITRANTGKHANKNIEAEFRLLNPDKNNDVLAVRKVAGELSGDWSEISGMFNSGDASRVKIQLVNTAPDGIGNDILLDDITFSVCNPQAALVFSGTTSSTSSISVRESKTLDASITSGLMTDSWYIWQSSTDNVNWSNISTTPVQVDVNSSAKLTVKPSATTYYRAIVANSQKEAQEILEGHDPSACGMYAITNIATLDVTIDNLELTSAIIDDDICMDGVDATTLTLTVKNPRLVNVTDVEVKLENITDLNITKVSGTGTYLSGVWTVGNLTDGATASIVLKITSNASVSAQISKVIVSYVSAVDNETYASYENAPADSKKQTTLQLNPLPAPPTLIKNGIYDECAKSGTVDLSTLATGTSLKFYSDAALTNTVTTYPLASEAVNNKEYYVTQTDDKGCTSPAAKISVTVKENPTLNSITVDKNSICKDESTAKLTYNISGGAAPYKLEIKRTENSKTETINATNLGESGKSSVIGEYTLNPSSDATYKFVKVTDNNNCSSESSTGLVDDVKINVTSLKLETDLQAETICADKKITYKITASGDDIHYKWYESIDNGVNYSVVGEDKNEYTTDEFEIDDTKKYKVVVYQESNVCSSKPSKESAVIVQDCSNLSLTSDITGGVSSVCKGDEITLNYSITNNAEEDAQDVIVTITGLSKQTLKTPITGYDHSTGIWNVGTLGKGKTAKLSITIKGSIVVKDDPIVAYISKSGSTTYDLNAPSTIKVSKTITVKKYSDKPTLISETYKDCPVEDMLNLDTQIETPTDKTTLKFYTDESRSTDVKQANKATVGTTTYYVTNTLDGECESDTTQLKIVVYPQPTASISGTTTICKGKSANLSVALTGTPSYTVKLSDGTEETLDATGIINVSPTSTTTYSLFEVKDKNGCYATLTGSATITVNDKPAVEVTQNPTQNVCDGDALTLPSVTVDANGSTITSTKWYFNGKEYKEGDKVEYSDDVDGVELKLEYEATNDCGSTKVDAGKYIIKPRPTLESFEITDEDNIICEGASTTLSVQFKGEAPFTFYINEEEYQTNNATWTTTITEAGTYTITALSDNYCAALDLTDNAETLEVEELPVVTLDATEVTLNCAKQTATITASGASTYEWSYVDESGATQTKTGATLDVKQTNKEVPTLVTEYSVYGYSEKAGCKSENAVTVEVTEDFVLPKVNITTYNFGMDVDLEKDLILTCNHYAVQLFADAANSPVEVANYEWSTGEKGEDYSIITADSAATYFVDITAVNGCKITDSIKVTENFKTPDISLTSYRIEKNERVESTVLTCTYQTLNLEATINNPEEIGVEDVYLYWSVDGHDFAGSNPLEISEEGVYTVFIQGDNYCKGDTSIVITAAQEHPVLTLTSSANEINCYTPSIDLEVESDIDSVSYDWIKWLQVSPDGSKEGEMVTGDSIATIDKGGYYEVIVTVDSTGCASSEKITIAENTRKPIINSLVSSTTLDKTIEGYKETKIVNCEDTELFIQSTVVDSIQVGYRPEELEYEWTVSYDDGDIFEEYGKSETISTKEEAIFRLVVTDKESGCSAVADSIHIKENKTTPTITAMTSVSTIDPSAEKVEETNVLTCEYPVLYLKPTITSENEFSYKWDDGSTENYREVKEEGTYSLVVTDNTSFCSTEEYKYSVTEDNDKPTLSVDTIYYLCPSDTLSITKLSSLLPKANGFIYKFYDESETEIEDLYEVPSESSATKYFVAGISDNGCISDTLSFSVDYAKNVDFTLTTSQTSMLVGGNETVVTIVPDADSEILDAYTWLVNGNEVDVDGLEHSSNLYIDTKFEVTATNRCDSDTKEAFVEVLWPTAFTPHNDNGKNEDFAKGMYIIVFNRFYTKIFEGPDGWDGTINGTMNESEQIAVPGVYYYSVKLPNGEVKKGTVEIVNVD